MRRSTRPVAVTLVIVPRFPLLSLAICIEAMRVANRESLHTAFTWTVATADGGPVRSSSGVAFTPDAAVGDIAESPVTVVLSAYEPETAFTRALLGWLRRQERRGGIVGGVDTGAFILAEAGLLRGAGVSVHHEALDPLREAHAPELVVDRLHAFEGQLLSSAGGMATMDMMLALIAKLVDEPLADRVADALNHVRLVDTASVRRAGRDGALARVDPVLARCIELMRERIDEPQPVAALARIVGVPGWRLRRLFRRHLRSTPSAYFMALRLERARMLLLNGHQAVREVALACGFSDAAAFSHAFKRHHGAAPTRYRARFAGRGLHAPQPSAHGSGDPPGSMPWD